MVMEILISLALLFGGIAALVVIHVCIVGRAFRGSYDHGRFVQGIGVGGGGGNKAMSNEDLKKLPCFEYKDPNLNPIFYGGGRLLQNSKRKPATEEEQTSSDNNL
ncbi:hypothetical protein Dsin_005003 [Dipteronia sinensis]|uniref:Uncharacterized protein n=1 Tax=Dipteronia sinensis TaxID=43782 RepID=A0AAE0EEA1_9ROSI|nr:hypothetical protein Dsin_005003 [Dipteronia sinensis]